MASSFQAFLNCHPTDKDTPNDKKKRTQCRELPLCAESGEGYQWQTLPSPVQCEETATRTRDLPVTGGKTLPLAPDPPFKDTPNDATHIYTFIKNSWFDLFYDICHYSGNQNLVYVKSKFDQTELCAKKVCFYTKTPFR